MSPGKAGEPGTHHPVYVTVGGEISNSVDFYMDAVTTHVGQTYSTSAYTGNHIASGTHDVLYDGCTFVATNQTLKGSEWGVVTLGQGGNDVSSITFLNCTIKSNLGVGSGGDYGVNGIKMVTGWGSTAVDISFVNCTVEEMSRMGFESVTDGVTRPARIAFIDTVFEPCGEEPISFNGGDLYSLVDGCWLKGFGNRTSPAPAYGNGFEINGGRYFEVRDTQIWAGAGSAINLSGASGTNRYILFDKVDVDFSHVYQKCPTTYGSRMFAFQRMSYVRLKDCTFNTGSTTNCVYNAGWANSDGGAGWSGCTYNDFRSSTITGYCNVNYPRIPATAAGYWDGQTNQTNFWPTAVR